jgi:hypothetical protein
MSVVAIYQFRGTFRVKPEFADAAPWGGVSRDGMLFVSQETAGRDDDAAVALCASRYEVTEVEIRGFGLLQLEVLEQEEYQGFRAQYEKTLRDGSALVYYPT